MKDQLDHCISTGKQTVIALMVVFGILITVGILTKG